MFIILSKEIQNKVQFQSNIKQDLLSIIEKGYIQFKENDIIEGETEQAYDGSWYLKGHAPEKPQALIDQERINELQAYLTSTDWYAVRLADTGVAIPADVVTARSSAREEISTLRVDVEELI